MGDRTRGKSWIVLLVLGQASDLTSELFIYDACTDHFSLFRPLSPPFPSHTGLTRKGGKEEGVRV